ncbi:hypothetical protein EDD11_000906 [Mortierella claussenii]|nr:hypothetical protein EDD11_000906 [Mortierella claussenii]
MEAVQQHSARPPPLPSKLRWRPYGSSGSSAKAKKAKKDEDQQQQHQQDQLQQQGFKPSQDHTRINPKALAHKVRDTHRHTVKQRSPATVELHWEQAETIESMSHGGHPNTPTHQHQRQSSPSDTDSTVSSSSASAPDRAALSLPSPPPCNSLTLDPLVLLGGEGGAMRLGQYKATLPSLNGNGLVLPTAEANTYQMAVNALLEHHHRNQILDAKQAPVLAWTSVPLPMTMASPPPSSNRQLSASEFLGMTSIEDLLASCGYKDVQESHSSSSSTKAATGTLASPATTDKSSVHSSPMHGVMDETQDHSFSSPTVMDISIASFDMLLAQTPEVLAEGDCRQVLQQLQQQEQLQYLDSSPTLSSASTITNSFAEIFHDLASPFLRLSSHGDPLINGNDNPASWTSLFPKPAQDDSNHNIGSISPRVDIAIQTETPFNTGSSPQDVLLSSPVSSLLPSRVISAESSPQLMTEPGLSPEELDPEWLSFLDDASPILGGAETELGDESMEEKERVSPLSSMSPTQSQSQVIPSPSPSPSPKMQSKSSTIGAWASGFLKNSAAAPTGHHGLPSAGSMGGLGGIYSNGTGASGGLIRTLQGGSYQQRSNFHSRASSRRATAATEHVASASITSKNTDHLEDQKPPEKNDKEDTKTLPQQAAAASSSQRDGSTAVASKQVNQTDIKNKKDSEGLGGLVALFRGLWKGGELE